MSADRVEFTVSARTLAEATERANDVLAGYGPGPWVYSTRATTAVVAAGDGAPIVWHVEVSAWQERG